MTEQNVNGEDEHAELGRSLFMRNMRKVLRRHGFEGEALEKRVRQLLRSDASRVAAIVWGATAEEATNMTIEQRRSYIEAKRFSDDPTSM